MNLTTLRFFTPPTLPLTSVAGISPLSDEAVDRPLVDLGVSRQLFAPGRLLAGQSFCSDQRAEVVLWDGGISDALGNGGLESTTLMVTGESSDMELSTFDSIVYGGLAVYAVLAILSVIGSVAITQGQRWANRREQARAAQHAKSADKHDQ